MTWVQATALVIVLVIVGWLAYDLLAFAFGGVGATISSVVLDWADDRRGVAIVVALVIGILIGHLFLPQRIG